MTHLLALDHARQNHVGHPGGRVHVHLHQVRHLLLGQVLEILGVRVADSDVVDQDADLERLQRSGNLGAGLLVEFGVVAHHVFRLHALRPIPDANRIVGWCRFRVLGREELAREERAVQTHVCCTSASVIMYCIFALVNLQTFRPIECRSCSKISALVGHHWLSPLPATGVRLVRLVGVGMG
eukprot:1195772-Prorocentrum_minimum.AAC.2